MAVYKVHTLYIYILVNEGPSLQFVPVVNEFLDVFLEDLTSNPPYREINFWINLLLNTYPISIIPYRMALVG